MGNDLRKVLKALEDQGFVLTRSTRGHWLIDTADGRRVGVLAGTGSDWRGMRNTIAHLRRAGFVWPPKR
jgi:hypothetical protein